MKIKNTPSVISNEKKVNMKPVLEINGDTAGNDKTTTPKKKMIWEKTNPTSNTGSNYTVTAKGKAVTDYNQ